jgi:hypothetical protein
MIPAIFKRKLFDLPNPNWLLWLCLSFPLGIYLLFTPWDHGDYIHTDAEDVAGYIMFLKKNIPYCPLSYYLFVLRDELTDSFIHCIWVPIIVGYFGQYVLMLLGYLFQRRGLGRR